jgi:SAM-dependent methyltransferase
MKCTFCNTVFPLVGDVPILINDDNSVFAIADYVDQPGYTGDSYGRDWDRTNSVKRYFRRIFRKLADAPSSLRHFGDEEAIAHVRRFFPSPRILVVGAGGRRHGDHSDRVACVDVALGPGVDVIADSHDLPFPDGSFDLIIAIALLEHVADPPRCVDEFCRVLRSDGFVYAITPFLQPVHMGAYDFTRYTPLGHRRLFRRFDVIDAGPALGVGTVAAWILSSFVQSMPVPAVLRRVLAAVALSCRPLLRLLDRPLSAPAYIDASGGNFFFGRQRSEAISDRAVIREYRGAFSTPK